MSREEGPRIHRLDFIEASLGILMWCEGVEKETAKQFLEKTAEKGFIGSISTLGYVYHSQGDYKKAMELYSKSNIMYSSMKGMASLYREGKGVEQDKKYAKSLDKVAKSIGAEYTHCRSGKALYV